ncbi:MAG: sigma-70 family RNA polymerase sigma factor [Planctomycetota bacterium]
MSEADSVAETTEILLAMGDNDPGAAERLMPRVYEELKRIAEGAMRRERKDHTLQPTALVNEAFLRLVDATRIEWQGRAHFFAVAAKMMRRILVSHARGRSAQKRGGDGNRIPIHNEMAVVHSTTDVDVLELDALLDQLAELNERHARVIELRFFAGLTIEEVAESLGISDWTVKNDWRVARAWLLRQLDGQTSGPAAELE